MFTRFSRFVRAVSVSPLGRIGAVLVTSSFITFVLMELARIGGVITNSYVGLITYLLLPFLFVVGLILLPIGPTRPASTTSRPIAAVPSA